jgi:pimeloyl-ACP methyl ester carboxylesterase
VTHRAAVAAVLLLGCAGGPLPDDQVFPAGTPFHTREIVVDSTRVRVIDTGRGTAVVLIHGLSASIYSWRFQLEPLLATGYRVIAYDNRGFGLADRPDHGYTNADYARLLGALLDSLGVGQAVLVGHSMGAAVAAEFALTHPDRVRGLALLGPAGYLTEARVLRWPVLGKLTGRASRATTRAMLLLCFADWRQVTEDVVEQYYAPLARPGTAQALRHVLRDFHFDGLRGRLASLEVPTLVLWGDGDLVIPFAAASGLASELPHAAFVLVRQAGHNLQEEQYQEVNRSLIAFLRNGLPQIRPDVAAGRSTPATRSTPSRTRGD